VKYSPRGGTVQVRARADGGEGGRRGGRRGRRAPEGDGVDLFAPFSQAGATNTREYGGVGLGLYIVRQLVEAQGGTVAAANRPGGGAVISFTLPLTRAPLAVDSAPVGSTCS
jgi:signal transduction histidine kinase